MYTQSITRANRALFVLAIDESGSMAELIHQGGRTLSKAEMLSEVANTIIAELIERSHRSEGIRNYYDVAIIGYSGDGIRSYFGQKDYLSIGEIAAMDVPTKQVTKEYVGADGQMKIITENLKCWVKAHASGKTPMYEALSYIYEFIMRWCSDPANINSFPPIIFNISDGLPTDGEQQDIENISSMIKSLSTNDGAALLSNIHIAPHTQENSMLFPTHEDIEPYIKSSSSIATLYESASVMPEIFNNIICEIKGVRHEGPFRGLCYNSSIAELLAILNIGSISVKHS